ncbi:MAG: YeeE/YedE family protein [Alphaproteobacteria bacterium]|nr:YeeE/YedE family protein [Alphaproteobacteria bacterium]
MIRVGGRLVLGERRGEGATRLGRHIWVAGAAALLLMAGTVGLAQASGWRLGALWLVGGALGLVLYRTMFGFASAFRALLNERRTIGFRAQLLMLALAVLLFFPALAAGEILGSPVRGFIFPVGVATLIGAFVFGIGMQIAGGCASGTLYTAGGGNPKMLIALPCFVIGMTAGAYSAELWGRLPALPGLSLVAEFGLWPALAVTLGVLAALWIAAAGHERKRHGRVQPLLLGGGPHRLLSHPWPLAWGALALALLNALTLCLAGRPWGITAALALWGSRTVDRLGLDDPVFWFYWEEPTRAEALHRSLLGDVTTVMDLGLMAGALLAAGLAGRFAPRWRMAPRELAGAVIGGLLLGYGAAMASGCNISAYFSGIASGSLHGWVWIVGALPGSAAGLVLRRRFGLDRG